MGEWVVNSVHIIYIYMSFIYSINIWLVFHKNKCIYIYIFICCSLLSGTFELSYGAKSSK